MTNTRDPWNYDGTIDLQHAIIRPYGGRMLAITVLGDRAKENYERLRHTLSLCPIHDWSIYTLSYDYAYHKQVMGIVNGGIVPPLKALLRQGAKLT